MTEARQQNRESGVGSLGGLDLGIMKQGDYMVHVFIEYGKNLKPEGSPDDSDAEQQIFDAVATVNCCGETRYSKKLGGVLMNSDEGVYWGEHFYFEPRNVTSDQIQAEILTIKVLEKGYFRDKEVGIFDMDLARIYFMND